MPELPELVVYALRLNQALAGSRLSGFEAHLPFTLRTLAPAASAIAGLRLERVERLGKRLVFAFEDDWYSLIHLMRSGRLYLRGVAQARRRIAVASWHFGEWVVDLTEAAKKKRASVHWFQDPRALEAFRPAGVEPMTASFDEFETSLRTENRTLKRALTDPRMVSGIGNAYSDDILHAARLSPFKRTHDCTREELRSLHESARRVLQEWTDALLARCPQGLPRATADERGPMRVHGRYRLPCPDCGAPICRVRYADSELNYCAACQTEGKVYADRSLSRLLRGDWPRTLDELEARGGLGERK